MKLTTYLNESFDNADTNDELIKAFEKIKAKVSKLAKDSGWKGLKFAIRTYDGTPVVSFMDENGKKFSRIPIADLSSNWTKMAGKSSYVN